VLNVNLKDTLRSNFAELLISLHMDCDPLDTMVIPEMTRVFNLLAKLDDVDQELPNNVEKIQLRPELQTLKDKIKEHLIAQKGHILAYDDKTREFNLLNFQYLRVLESMIKLGFYKLESELIYILEPLINLLDGSLDFYSPEEVNIFEANAANPNY